VTFCLSVKPSMACQYLHKVVMLQWKMKMKYEQLKKPVATELMSQLKPYVKEEGND